MEHKYIKYPDGFGYWEIDNFDTSFVYKINSYEDLFKLKKLVSAFGEQNLQITIPCLPDAQADDEFKSNSEFGLKIVLRFLNSMKNVTWVIYHPHNPQVVKVLLDKVIIMDNEIFIRDVLREIDTKNLILMSSDAGGFKPLMKLCEQLNWQGETYSAAKARNPETGKLTQLIDREDFGGKDILIVDDICVYGGTFKGLATMLKERNVGKLYLAVSHMTVNKLGIKPVTNFFNKVFTTNSKYDKYYNIVTTPKNLEIIKMF